MSGASLEPSRHSRHRHGNRSHAYQEFAHMLSITEREAKEMRRGLRAALDNLDRARERASKAEQIARQMAVRLREADDERLTVTRQTAATREELGMYKAQISTAQAELQRAQEMFRDQEKLRYDADASAARARDTARQLSTELKVDRAREEGRKAGFRD
ncbi:hypothetical protein BV25DRAFT_1798061, partial [Artomyces pyxidatus]